MPTHHPTTHKRLHGPARFLNLGRVALALRNAAKPTVMLKHEHPRRRALAKMLSLASVLVLLAACASVPTTTVTFNPATGAVSVKSPKQVTSKDFKAVINNPSGVSATVSWKELSALNDAQVIHAAGAAEAQVIEATTGLVKQVGDTGAQLSKGAMVP